MDKLANAITNYYIRKEVIKKEQQEIYCYGFKLIIADMINFIIIIVFGMILHRELDSVIFLIVLCGLRQFTGGFHAKTFWMCRMSMVMTYVCVMSIVDMVAQISHRIFAVILINLLCIIFIFVFSPIENRNKPLALHQKNANKIKSIITSIFIAITSFKLAVANTKIGVTISITMLAVVVLMAIAIASQKGGK